MEMDKIYNKKTSTFHNIDIIESFESETVVFTTDSKCFPLAEVCVMSGEKFKSLCGKVYDKSVTENDHYELDLYLKNVNFTPWVHGSEEKTKQVLQEIRSSICSKSYVEKSTKTTKEYLLSPLSNLWSILARPWTSKG